MNITLSVDDEIVARARKIAREQGISLNEMIRRHLEMVAGCRSSSQIVAELQSLWDKHPGHSRRRKISRDEAYEGRL